MILTHCVRMCILWKFEFIQISHLWTWSLGKRVLNSKHSLKGSGSKPALLEFPQCLFQTAQVVLFLRVALGVKVQKVWSTLEIYFFLVAMLQKSYNFHKNQQNQEWGVGEWRGGPKTPSPYVFSDNTPFGSVLVLWPIIKDCFKREATALPDKSSTPAVKCSPEPWETKDDTDEKWSHHCWWGSAYSQVCGSSVLRASTWFFQSNCMPSLAESRWQTMLKG